MLLFAERVMGSPEASSSPSAERDGYLIGQGTSLPLRQATLSLGLSGEGWRLNIIRVHVFHHVNGCLCILSKTLGDSGSYDQGSSDNRCGHHK